MAALTQFGLPAPGKINLCLNITGRRADGYHLLQTAFQLLDIADWIHFAPAADIQVVADVAIDAEQNLVFKAAQALAKAAGINMGARLVLTKKLPMGAGMGGGSSDAATTLMGLNLPWGLHFSQAELQQIAEPLGADVPVFVFGRSAWAEGIGADLVALSLPVKFYLIIQPGCVISTAEIFLHPQLTRGSAAITIARFLEPGKNNGLGAGTLQGRTGRVNDCEAVVRSLYPEVDEAILWLNKWGAARMTGTGSCVFLDFDSKEAALAVAKHVPEKWQAYIAKAVNDSPVQAVLAQLKSDQVNSAK